MMAWETQEAEVFTRMMLMAEIPATLSHLFYFFTAALAEGIFTLSAGTNLLLLLLSRLFFKRLGRIHNPKTRFWTIFSLYQVVQVVIVGCELGENQESFVVNLVASTVVLMIGEVSPIHSTVVNGAIVAKHITLWTFVSWKYFPKQEIRCVQLAWIFFDILMAQTLKKRILKDKQRAEEQRSQEEQRLKSLLSSIPDGIIVISERKEVVSYNPALLSQFSIAGSVYISQRLMQVISGLEYDREYVKDSDSRFFSDLVAFMSESEGALHNFQPVTHGSKYFECRGCIAHWDDRKAVVLTIRDTSNWVAMEKAAKMDSENKTALLRSVSHELRTPVNAILNLAQDLQTSGNASEQEKTDIDVILSASNFLMSMINDLLDYSRIIHDKFALVKSNFELENVIRGCGLLVQPQCRQKNVKFSIRYDRLLPTHVYTDENRLKQVILNLLSNAAKFTLKGSVTLVANLSGRDKLKVSVEDTGIGIQKDKIQKVFTMFGKLDGNQEINPQGCGLGLSISSMLVSKLGGSGIEVSSVVSKGSVFSFSIPIGTATTEESFEKIVTEGSEEIPEEFVNSTEISPSGHTRQKGNTDVLIVDDSPFNRLVIRKMLDVEGYTHAEAATGLEALDKVKEANEHGFPFPIIIMDVEMPEMDGITATKEVQRLYDFGQISKKPVIIGCSAFCSEEDRAIALAAGMNYYMEKPVSREKLHQLLSKFSV